MRLSPDGLPARVTFVRDLGEHRLRWTNLFIRDTLKQGRLAAGFNRNVTDQDPDLPPSLIEQNSYWFERQLIELQVDGRMRKFFEEVALLSQAFVINPDLTVGDAVKAAEISLAKAMAQASCVERCLPRPAWVRVLPVR